MDKASVHPDAAVAISVNGTSQSSTDVSLNVGSNLIVIEANDGNQKIYEINLNRQSMCPQRS